MTYDVTTIGDVLKDIFVFPMPEEMEKDRSKKHLLFDYGEKITIQDIQYDVGGSAGNVAAGLAKIGLKTSIISSIGKDSEGEEVLRKLKNAKVDVSQITIDNHKKTSFSLIISYQGERTIFVFHSFIAGDFKLPAKIDSDWLYVGPLGEGYRPLYSAATALVAEHGINVAINPGSIQVGDGLQGFGGLLRVAKILFVNKEEGQKLAGISGMAAPKEIIKILQKTGVETIVMTDGKNGAYAAQGDEFMKIGIYPGEKVESTGAGDAFASAYLAGVLKKQKMFDCLKWGVTNSASVVGKVGAQSGLLSLPTIKKNIANYRWPAETLRFS